MNTTQLKSFAAEARKSLLSGVKSKMNALGFKDNGSVDERDYPIQAHDGTLFQNEIYDVAFYGKWMRLRDEIARYGFRQVCEEGAYTWFNRLVAIQILSRNGLIDPVLEFESPDVRIPLLVKQAHEGIRPDMATFDAMRLNAVIDDDNRIVEQFAILIVAYCQSTPILYKCFGTLNDFTELLLPTNILASNGFLNLLNGSSFITDDDYKTTELIGWLYQFYISERKDEVFTSFKNGHKAEAEDIPAATQIFTPNWIVKYMVQNTLGRIYLDNNPNSDLASNWQYLVEAPEPVEGPSRVPRLEISNPEDLTFADLSCGSGHILGEAFDMLFEIYKEEGYTRRKAIENIFTHNLVGVDIDTRAKQLATFALMLKACQYWPDAIQCSVMPQVFDMPLPDDPICERYPILKQANNLGSIMKIEALEGETHPLVLALTRKYAAIAMNPPYMGSGNMNADLAKYVKDNYEIGKADLCTTFMLKAINCTLENGYWSMINLPSWMFIASFYELRKLVIKSQQIDSLLHLGRGVFGSDFGTVAFAIQNVLPYKKGLYRRLFKEHVQVRSVEHIRQLYLDKGYGYYISNQKDFVRIKSCPIGYWISEAMYKVFDNSTLSQYGTTRKGMYTGCNEQYVRTWYEISSFDIGFNQTPETYSLCHKKWFPYANGGDYRKWYGNLLDVVNWENDGEELRTYRNSDGKIRAGCFNLDYIFHEGMFWSSISAKQYSMKYLPLGNMFSSASNAWFPKDGKHTLYVLANVNSCVSRVIMNVMNPTLNINAGDIINIPIIIKDEEAIEDVTKENISISKADWDAHETSWDFQENELIRLYKQGLGTFKVGFDNAPKTNFVALDLLVEEYKAYWMEKFNQLHDNEEELNRKFIEIYGLQDELSPDVPLEEVTILQQGEISIEDK